MDRPCIYRDLCGCLLSQKVSKSSRPALLIISWRKLEERGGVWRLPWICWYIERVLGYYSMGAIESLHKPTTPYNGKYKYDISLTSIWYSLGQTLSVVLYYFLHCKKGYWFSRLVSDIPAGDGKIANLFLQCIEHSITFFSCFRCCFLMAPSRSAVRGPQRLWTTTWQTSSAGFNPNQTKPNHA